MATFLQNHPGSRRLPVRPGRSSLAVTTSADAHGGWRRITVVASPLLVLVIAGWGAQIPLAVRVTLVSLLLLAYFGGIFGWRMLAPVIQQRRYYRTAGIEPPSERERRALRLGGSHAYLVGWWPLTLEPFPVLELVGGPRTRPSAARSPSGTTSPR